jgi:tripartite-type tricarboxylate transporter receptor subunit TctC
VAQTNRFNMASRRRVIRAAAFLAAGIAAPTILRNRTAFAAYPDRAVKIVVANSPGGPSDIVARLLAASLQQAIGGSFVVENKGGAGGNIGMGAAARADPDGYTLLITTSAYVVNPGLYNSLPYDPFKEFVAIAELASTPNVFAVKPQLGVKTMRELAALAKANPDQFNVSTPPIGTTPYLAIELLKVREGLPKLPILVFAGGGEALAGAPREYRAAQRRRVGARPGQAGHLRQAGRIGFSGRSQTGESPYGAHRREVPMFRELINQAGIKKL